MTEYAIPLDDLMNGQEKEFLPEPEKLPRVDAARGVFITSRGEEIELSDKPVSVLIVERLKQEGRPKIPMIETTILGRKQSEPHVGHEGYQARLKEWAADSEMAMLRYIYVVGTKGTPPPEFVEEQSTFFPNATAAEMKYLWIASRMPEDDLGAFTEVLLGRAIPTPKAVEEVANFTAST